jgi:hypothetical protein
MSTPRTALACSGLVVIFLALGCGQKPSDDTVPKINLDLPGCQAAVANVDYGNVLAIPDEVKTVIEIYREDWRGFCGDAKSGKPSMANLLVKAKAVEERFGNVIQKHNDSLTTEERYARADAVSDLVVNKYPAFVPGFEGSYFEQEYFRPSTVEFRKHVRLGTDEDKRFFGAGITLQTEFPQWMDRTWDYGGCWRFGAFNWTEEVDKVLQLKKDIQTDIYQKLISEYEDSLMGPLTSEDGMICTCERKDAVAEDLRRALAYLEQDPILSEYATRVRAKLKAIEEKKTTVNSEAEKHCSGG